MTHWSDRQYEVWIMRSPGSVFPRLYEGGQTRQGAYDIADRLIERGIAWTVEIRRTGRSSAVDVLQAVAVEVKG